MINIKDYRFNSELLKQCIKDKKISRKTFCKRCKIKKRTYKKIMKGSLKLDLNAARALCDLFNISCDSLVIKK